MRDAQAKDMPVAPRLLGKHAGLLAALMAPHAVTKAIPRLSISPSAGDCWRCISRAGCRTLAVAPAMAISSRPGDPGAPGSTTDAPARYGIAGVVMLGLESCWSCVRGRTSTSQCFGYFVVLTQFLYSQSPGLAVYLFAGTLALAAIQIGLNRVSAHPRQILRRAPGCSSRRCRWHWWCSCCSHRLHSPLWGIKSQRAFTGISGDDPGNLGELSRSTAKPLSACSSTPRCRSGTALLAWACVMAHRWSPLDSRPRQRKADRLSAGTRWQSVYEGHPGADR